MKTSQWRALVILIAVPLLAPLIPGSVALAEEKTEIVIGASLPLSGNLADSGRDLKWAYDLAASDINATGGIFVKEYGKKLKVRMLIVDHGTNTIKAASQVQELISVNNVDMLLGGYASAIDVLPGAMMAEKHQKYFHTSFSFLPLWRDKKFKWATCLFFEFEQACSVPFKILESMDEKVRPKKLALAFEDAFSGESFSKGFQEAAKKHGYNFVAELRLPLGAADYSPQISKAKELGVDAIFVLCPNEDLKRFVQQIKKHNLNISYMHTWKGGWQGKFWKDLGKDAQYIICDGFWSMDYPYPGSKELGKRYYEAFGQYSVAVGLPYALCQILFQAIEKAGSLDGAKVRNAVLTNNFDTVMGPVKYNSDEGMGIFPQIAAQWWDGKQMVVFPSEYAIWKTKLAPPWDQR